MLVIDFAKQLIFPGIIFVLYVSFVLAWFVRKITAKIENRIGPPFNQPVFDFVKLLAKERIYPEGSTKWILHYMPVFQLGIALLMSSFIPIYSEEGLISFDGDVYLFLFLLAIHGTTAFFVGWASRNPYSISGAGRAVLTEISLEIPLAISLAGISILTGSMRISIMSQQVWKAILLNGDKLELDVSILFVIPWLMMLVTSIYATLGALELSPFSAAHAETEIVGGWNTELTGSDLAFTKLADMVNLFNLGGLIACIFFGGPILIATSSNIAGDMLRGLIGLISFLLILFIIVFVIAFIRTLSSRLRIDQITDVLWIYFYPISMISVLFVITIKQLGG